MEKSYAERHEDLKKECYNKIRDIVIKRRGKVLIPYYYYKGKEQYDKDLPALIDYPYDMRLGPGRNLKVVVQEEYENRKTTEIVAVVCCQNVSMIDKKQDVYYLRDVVSLIDWFKIHSALVEITKK